MPHNIKLTILMPLYNKEKYVADALNSIVKQKTDFDYEVIVLDDRSTDRSVKIVRTFFNKINNLKIIQNKFNKGLFKNILNGYTYLTRDFFCVLDPDDYWTDDKYLQNALDFLIKHPAYTIYSRNVEILKDGKTTLYVKKPFLHTSFKISDLIIKEVYLSCTVGSVFRNVVFKNGIIPVKLEKLIKDYDCETLRGDMFRNIAHLEHGKAYFYNKSSGIYRYTEEGIWSSLSEEDHIRTFYLQNTLLSLYVDDINVKKFFKNRKIPKFHQTDNRLLKLKLIFYNFLLFILYYSPFRQKLIKRVNYYMSKYE